MNAKMKTLSLAVLGLVGIGAAGSAMAVCPSNPFAAWSGGAPTVFQGTVVGNPTGMLSTACKMEAQFAASSPSNGAQAVVIDQTPANETQYRFRFYVNAETVRAGMSGSTPVVLFRGTSQDPHGAGEQNVVKIILRASAVGSPLIRVSAACTTGDNQINNACRPGSDIALPVGDTRIEGQVILGAAGTGKVNLWIGSNVTPGSPDRTVNVDNAAWVGVKQATLGLSGASSFFRTQFATTSVFFDEFDSRRQTFIGN